MTPTYRYVLCDLLTDQPLATLPMTGVTFDRRISRVGSFQGQFSAPTARLVSLAQKCHDYAGRSALWVYRNGTLWWGGIPWIVQPAQDGAGPVTCQITAATFDSYAHHRELYADKTYTGVDQGVVIPDLWRTIQAEAGGNIGVVAEDQPTGVTRTRTYLADEQAKVGKLIEDLGDVIDGPEHTVDVFLDGAGRRTKALRVANRLGNPVPMTVFQRAAGGGGNVTGWAHTADAVDGGTSFQTRGNDGLVSTRVQRTDLLDAGWPLLDVSADHPGVSVPATLDGYAEALAARNAGAMATQDYRVNVGDSAWTPNRIGDAVRIKLKDQWHDNTDVVVRPVGCVVTPPGRGKDEQVTLLLGDE